MTRPGDRRRLQVRDLHEVRPGRPVTLNIENKGSKATEVEVLFPDDRIVSEKENIGPGTKYTLTAEVKAGSYEMPAGPA